MKFRRVWQSLALLVLVVGVATAASLYIWLKPYRDRAQAFDLAKIDESNVTTIFYDRHDDEIGRLFFEDRILLSHSQIPDLMRKAAMAVEARRFYDHGGVDLRGLFRALSRNTRSRSVV